MARQLILNDGTILNDSEAGYADGFLWLYITGISLQEVAMMAFNPEKTKKIIFRYEHMQDTYEGFTECINLSISFDGQVSVCMKKGVVADVEH